MTIDISDRRTSEVVYPNGCLYIMGYSWGYQQVLAVDIEGETWRKIPCPPVSTFSIHQAQDHLWLCTFHGCVYPKLSIWILEDYGTTYKCILKHTFSILDVLLMTNIDFGYLDVDQYYTAIHPEWNRLLFVGVGDKNDIVAYNMDNRKVHVIPTCYSAFFKWDVLPQNNCRPYYLPYVP